MAYRRSNGKGRRKLEPAAMNLSFTAVGTGTNYIDLSKAASIVNRRFYRQGINWSVAGFTVTVTGTTTSPGSVTVCKVPTTWVAYNAWKKSKAMWDRMNDQVMDENGDIDGKYADFKVYLDTGHAASTEQTNITAPLDGESLLPTDCAYNKPSTHGREWNYSNIQIPDTGGSLPPQQFGLKFLGADTVTEKGLITGYAASRVRPMTNPGEPNVPTDGGWMQDLFDTGDNFEEIRDQLEAQNDRPPYSVGTPGTAAEYYPGGSTQLSAPEVVGYGTFSTAGGGGSITAQRSIKGGMFPCGLIAINSALPGITFYDIIVHLVPGNHRGYLCEPMGDA